MNEITLENIGIEVIDGDRGKNYPHQDELLSKGDCLFLSAKNVTSNGFDFSDNQFITFEKDALLRKGKLIRGDIVITTRGTVGNVALYDDSVPFEDIRINSGMLIVRCGEVISKEYLYNVLRSRWFFQKIKAMQTGSAQPQLPKSHFLKMQIPVPERNVQEKIADIIMQFDYKIRCNEAINRNLSEQAMAVYNDRFGTLEKTKVLEEYPVKIYSGGTPSTTKKEYWESGDIHWLSSGETANDFVITTEKKITQLGADKSSTKWAKKYDVVTASAGQGHTRGQTTMLLLDTCINQSVIVIHAEKDYMPFIFFNISGRYEELRVLSDGTSTRGSLTIKIMAKLEMPDVPIEEISSFSNYAWPIISRIEVNLKENERLIALRDSLLPKLMSGELDVSELSI